MNMQAKSCLAVSRRFLLMLAAMLVAAHLAAFAQWADLGPSDKAAAKNALAFQFLQDGRVEEASTLLRANLVANSQDAYAHQLLCRVFYAQDRADEAIHECELAAGASNQSRKAASENQLWLGRAYGMKARHAGPIAGFKLARR